MKDYLVCFALFLIGQTICFILVSPFYAYLLPAMIISFIWLYGTYDEKLKRKKNLLISLMIPIVILISAIIMVIECHKNPPQSHEVVFWISFLAITSLINYSFRKPS